MSHNSEFDDILKDYFNSIPDIKLCLIIDRNGNMIASMAPEGVDIESITVSAILTLLSSQKLVIQIISGKIDNIMLRNPNGYLLLSYIDADRILVTGLGRDVRLGLIFLDTKRTIEKMSKIPYEMPERKVSFTKKLDEIEEILLENYKIFISYARADSEHFRISEFGNFLEDEFSDVEVMYFEKSKTAGEDILDYMTRGVKWCNVFVWFHSENAEKSSAVEKEYKMAEYLSKNIVSITEDRNRLPLSAKVGWVFPFNEIVEDLSNNIYNNLKDVLNK